MRKLFGIVILAAIVPASGALGAVGMSMTDSDGFLDATSTVAGPGQSFTVAINLGISGGETVGGVTCLLQADKPNVLKMTGRNIQSAVLSDPTTDIAGFPDLNPVTTQDVGTTTLNVNTGVNQSETVMLLTLEVKAGTPLNAYPITLTFNKARWATTGASSVSAPADIAGIVYTIFPPCSSAPAIASAASVKLHGAGAGARKIALNLAGAATLETRDGGVTQIQVTYDKPIAAAPGGLTVNVVGAALNGLPSINGNVLTINLTGSAERTCLSATIDGIACADGAITAPVATIKVAVRHDIDGNNIVTSADSLALKPFFSPFLVTDLNCKYDVNLDGRVTSADSLSIKPHFSPFPTPACQY